MAGYPSPVSEVAAQASLTPSAPASIDGLPAAEAGELDYWLERVYGQLRERELRVQESAGRNDVRLQGHYG